LGNLPNILKSNNNSCLPKNAKISVKVQSEIPHNTTFETLKYLQQNML
jgi:hypothetical protein